jgi:tetratricopeptide (TPR) repeat protein
MVFAFIKAIFNKADSKSLVSALTPAKKSNTQLIDISQAKRILLPHVPTIREYEEKFIEQDQTYWDAYNLGFSHYKRGWYEKARAEFLKIYDRQPHDKTYFTHLLRTYRKIVAAKLEKKKPDEAFAAVQELLERCPNHSATDVRTHNKLVDVLDLDLPKKEAVEPVAEPEFVIKGEGCAGIAEGKKPKGFKIEFVYEEISPYRIQKMAQTLWPPLPHIQFDDTSIAYREKPTYTRLPGVAYRVTTVAGNADRIMYGTDDLRLRLADWGIHTIRELDCSQYAANKYHLRCVDMAGDLSCFLFTVIDDCFLLDADFKIINTWKMPYKIDTNSGKYERRSRSESLAEENDVGTRWAFSTLGVTVERPTTDDIKQAYRDMTKQYHPDRNRAPDAEERMKEIIRAYDYIREHGVAGVDRAALEDEYWVEIMSRQTVEVEGFSLNIELGMSIDPSDWIYGSGMSDDGSRVYLGVYSGKVYEISQEGIAAHIYEIPNGESANVIREDGPFLHILTFSQMYVLESETGQCIKTLQVRGESVSSTACIRFFQGGFLHILEHAVIVYTANGTELCRIRFESAPKYVCLSPDGKLIVETGKKLHLFTTSKS